MKDARLFTFKLGEGDNVRSFSYPVAEVRRLAKALGMDLELDREFMWFLKQALVTILPQGWQKEVDPKGLTQYHNQITGTTTQMHPLLYVFRAAFNRLSEGAVKKKTIVERTEDRKLTNREKRLEPTDIVSLQSPSDHSTHFSTLLKKIEQKQASSPLSPKVMQDTELFYDALLPDSVLPKTLEESLEYRCLDPKDVFAAAQELGAGADYRLFWVARLYLSVPLPPLWKRVYDAFRNIVYINQYYDIVSDTHPGKQFFVKLVRKLKALGRQPMESVMTFVDREFREYDVDLKRLITGQEYVLEVRPATISRPTPNLFMQKSNASESLSDIMALEIAESCGLSMMDDLHLLGIVYQHLAEKKERKELAGWEFRFTVEGQKYWYHPETQRASKSYPFRTRLKTLIAVTRLRSFRAFEKMGRERADLHPCFADKSAEFVTETRQSAAAAVRHFLECKLTDSVIEPFTLVDTVQSLNYTPSGRQDLDAILFACPFRNGELISEDGASSEGEFDSRSEGLGIVEEEDIKDMLDDIRRDIEKTSGWSKSLATKAVMGLISKPKAPPPVGRRKGAQSSLSIPLLLPSVLPLVDKPTVTEKTAEQPPVTPRTPNATAALPVSETVQSLVQNLLKTGAKGGVTGRLITGSTVAVPPAPLNEGSILTEVLSEKEISAVKTLREKLNLPSIEISKKPEATQRASRRHDTLKPETTTEDSPNIRKQKNRKLTNVNFKSIEEEKEKGDSPKSDKRAKSPRSSRANSKVSTPPRQPPPVSVPTKKFTINIRPAADSIGSSGNPPVEISFARTEDEESKPEESKFEAEFDEDLPDGFSALAMRELLNAPELKPWEQEEQSRQEISVLQGSSDKELSEESDAMLQVERSASLQVPQTPPSGQPDRPSTPYCAKPAVSTPVLRFHLLQLFKPLVLTSIPVSPRRPGLLPVPPSPKLLTVPKSASELQRPQSLTESLLGMYAKRSFARQKEVESSSIRNTLKAIEEAKPRSPDIDKSPRRRNRILELLAVERAKRIQTESKGSIEEISRVWTDIAASVKKPEPTPAVQAPEPTAPSAVTTASPTEKPESPKSPKKQPLVIVSVPMVEAEQSRMSTPLATISEERQPPATDRPVLTSEMSRIHIRNLDDRPRKTLPPLPLHSSEKTGEDSCLRISKRSTSCISVQTFSTDVDSPGPKTPATLLWGVKPAALNEVENMKYYTMLVGSPFSAPNMKRFIAISGLMPAHVVSMARRMGIHAEMRAFESRESDLLWIAYIQLVLPPPSTFPLLPLSTLVSLPFHQHPGDKFFALMLEYHRTSRAQELRLMEKSQRVRSVVAKSWLEFLTKGKDRVRYNFMTGQEAAFPDTCKAEEVPQRTQTPHFAKLLRHVKLREQTSSCSDFRKAMHTPATTSSRFSHLPRASSRASL